MNIGAHTEIMISLGTIVAVIVFFVSSAIKFTSLKENVEFRLKNTEELNKSQEKEIAILKDKINKSDVAFMEIRTKLANIEAMLVEIKKQK